jgi:hypothetical protein
MIKQIECIECVVLLRTFRVLSIPQCSFDMILATALVEGLGIYCFILQIYNIHLISSLYCYQNRSSCFIYLVSSQQGSCIPAVPCI